MTEQSAAQTTACRVGAVETAADDVRIVRLEPEADALFDWRPGQYASFIFDGCEPRDFSIANGPEPDGIEMHVRRSGAGGVSDHICANVKAGDPVTVKGPFGGAYLRENHAGPILAIAGGTGLAPMKAIVETALASGFKMDVHLYYGVQTEADLYLERHFIELARDHATFRFVPVIANPTENSGRRSGLVGDAVGADFQLLYGHQCYIGGPPAMAEACRTMLKLKSVPDHDIFSDAFF